MSPYLQIHSCRIKNPNQFQAGSFRTMRTNIKGLTVIIGRLKGKTTTTTQGYRYDKSDWTEERARKHCKAHNGIKFEPALK